MPDIDPKGNRPLQSIDDALAAFAVAIGLDVSRVTLQGEIRCHSCEDVSGHFCRTVMRSPEGCSRCAESHASAGERAAQLGEAYVTRCHAGVVFVTAPLFLSGEYAGSISCQPALMWDLDEVAVHEFLEKAMELGIPPESLIADSHAVSVISTRRMRAISTTLYALSAELSGGEHETLAERRKRNYQQMRLANVVDEHKRKSSPSEEHIAEPYPLQLERELLGKVRLGDQTGARGILNNMLGQIFYRTAGNVDVMKARILELVIMISRAAVESGAELKSLLGLNYDFIAELSTLTAYEDICMWVVKVLDTFMETVYQSRNVRNSHLLSQALEFIRSQYRQNVTLDSVAQHVHISPFYLSHLFKEELGITFVEYLTRIRIDEAKTLLQTTSQSMTQIASTVGYEDASYFSKVFKKTIGMTPVRYRKGV